MFLCVGLGGLLINGSYLRECGLETKKIDITVDSSRILKLFHFFRHVCSRIFIVWLWVGIYNSLGFWADDMKYRTEVLISYFIVGNVLVALTNLSPVNLWAVARGYRRPVVDFDTAVRSERIKHSVRATLGMLGDILMWRSIDGIYVKYESPEEDQELLDKIFLACFGLVLMLITRTISSHASLRIERFDFFALGMSQRVSHESAQSLAETDAILRPHAGSEHGIKVPGAMVSTTGTSEVTYEWCDALLDNLGTIGYLCFWCGIESSFYFFLPRAGG